MRSQEKLDQAIKNSQAILEKNPENQRLKILKDISDDARAINSTSSGYGGLAGLIVGIGAAAATFITGPKGSELPPEVVNLAPSVALLIPVLVGLYTGHKIGSKKVDKFIDQETARQKITL